MNATMSISDAWIDEGDSGTKQMTFTVQLSEPAAGTVTVNYTTADFTAKAKSDYLPSKGTLTFNPGETTKTITVTVVGDKRVEDYETFSVRLFSGLGADIADGIGVGTIANDDYQVPDHDPGCGGPHSRTC